MLQKTIASYGGPYVDGKPVEDPTSQMAAALGNRFLEDCAQLTIAGLRAGVVFGAVAAGNATVLSAWSVWGSGSGVYPTVTRTGVGLYTVTYAVSYTDSLNAVETVGFIDADGGIRSTTVFGSVQCAVASNVISLVTLSTAGAAFDPAPGTKIAVWAR